MEIFVYAYQYAIYFYASSIAVIYLLLSGVGYLNMRKMKATYSVEEEDKLKAHPEIAPAISVVAPAYNEEVIIIENVTSLLNLDYPNFEVIIVNDGSKDKTLELLIEHFELVEIPYPYIAKVRCQQVTRVFRSNNASHHRLTVVDKVNGGTKADAMNAGINVAQYDYFINTDVDCILSKDTLSKVILPVLNSSVPVIAVGAVMRMVNGCEVSQGEITRVKPPKGAIPLFQETEYLRSYLLAKMGWSFFKLIPNVSGGFGLFDRKIVIDVGGYDSASHAEDMDMTIRMVGHMRKQKKKYKIIQIPDTCCWTEGPPNLKVLARQRTRWGRGLLQIFIVHKGILFNRRYGRLGLVVLPYALIFEFLAPVIEFLGFVFTLLLLFSGYKTSDTFWLMLVFVYMISISMSIATISMDLSVKKQYKSYREYILLVIFSSFEAVLYHPLIVFFSIKGYWQFLVQREFSWGAMTRQGFSSETQNTQEQA